MKVIANKYGAYSLSEHQVWRPGSFESREAAERASRLSDEEIHRLQDAANARGDGVIRAADIEGVK